MKRRALLIGSPGIVGTKNYLEDMTKNDLLKVKKYLMSNNGGKWQGEEIFLIDTNDINKVNKYIKTVKEEKNDFLFCVFTGHGWYDDYKSSRVFEVGESSLYESELRQLSTKQISIFDSCAEILKRKELNAIFESRMSLGIDRFDDKNYRLIYENMIEECREQNVTLYSSSVDEFSQTDKDIGGHFIHYLLESGRHNQTKNLDVLDVFLEAKTKMKEDKRSQTPSSSYPKSARNYLPFSLGRHA